MYVFVRGYAVVQVLVCWTFSYKVMGSVSTRAEICFEMFAARVSPSCRGCNETLSGKLYLGSEVLGNIASCFTDILSFNDW